MNIDASATPADTESMMLEDLLQYAISGQTDGQAFAQLNDTVYQRLQQAYGAMTSEPSRDAA
ncbi:hypothetical protein [Xanthomonas maliensis]|uniref:hypothetical protein n=1 Tax=Xanthomonas maliensis TaxID=1321368 RepID=UPI0003A3BC7D|nr:hypothetical protein [Xanthomonas maliensis]